MKKALVNLLIVFSMILCGFVAFQWYREAKLRAELQSHAQEIGKKNEEISNLEGTLATMKTEIARLDALKSELTEAAKTNRHELGEMKIELKRKAGEAETLAKQMNAYKTALEKANEGIKQQNENLQKIVDDAKKLADERNEAIIKNNKMIEQYNDLVKQFNQLQEKLATAQGAAKPQ